MSEYIIIIPEKIQRRQHQYNVYSAYLETPYEIMITVEREKDTNSKY